MADDIPATTDEFRNDELTSLSLWRWLWSPWTWLTGLAILILLVAELENRVLQHEGDLANLLHQRRYGMELQYEPGWLRRLIPIRWGPRAHIFGDRAVQLRVALTRPNLEPLDDLVPEFQRLSSLQEAQFVASEFGSGLNLHPQSLPTSINSLRHCMMALEKVGSLKEVSLAGFAESQLSNDFVQCLQVLDIEHLVLFDCRCSEADVAQLTMLGSLKRLSFVSCHPSEDCIRNFKDARPDVTVQTK